MLNFVVDRSVGAVLQAVADPTRRAMVERLARGATAVGELAAPLAMSLPAVMKHVAVLEAAGVIRTQKVGRVRTCTLEPGSLGVLRTWAEHQQTAWERALDDLGEFIDSQTRGNDHE